MNTQSNMRRFILQRNEDASGVSGTGTVAEGIEFTGGKVAMTWLTPMAIVEVADSIHVIEAIHGHEGRTIVVWLDETPRATDTRKTTRRKPKAVE